MSTEFPSFRIAGTTTKVILKVTVLLFFNLLQMNSHWMKLSMIWWIMQIEAGVRHYNPERIKVGRWNERSALHLMCDAE